MCTINGMTFRSPSCCLFPKATASTRSTAWDTTADSKNGTVRSPHPSLAAQLLRQSVKEIILTV